MPNYQGTPVKATKLLPILLALGVSLSACQTQTKKIGCSNEAGLSSVISALTKDAEQEIKSTNSKVSISAIRAAINNLTFSIKDVRTSKEDPSSTKVFCEATFVANIPVNVIEDANEAMKKAGYDSNVELALEEHGFEISSAAANSYQTTISYNLQPTDDGESILSRIDEGEKQVVNAIHDLIIWSMAKNELAKQSDKITQAEIETTQATDTVQTSLTAPSQANTAILSNSSISASSVTPLCTYRARISENDKYSSSGNYIATKTNKATAAGVLRQDRANYHKFGIRDSEDMDDCLMNSASWRAKFEKMIANGTADNSSIDAIVNGNPLVTVDLYEDSINVIVN